MASLKHRAEYVAALGGIRFVRLLTPRLADRFAVALGTVIWRLAGGRRRLAIENLTACFGDRFTQAEVRDIAKRVFQNLARSFIEFARVPKLGPNGLRAMMVENGAEHIRRAHDEGSGTVLVTAHFGSWELVGYWCGLHGVRTHIMVYRQHNPYINRLVNELRESFGPRMIEVPEGSKEVFRALKRNELVAAACDQHAPAGTIIMDFLGRPAAVARGPALFAVRCGSPILPYLLVRERFDRFVLVAGSPIYPPRSGDESSDIRAMTAAWVRFFEDGIRKYPDQWMWTHNRWKAAVEKNGEESETS